MLIDERAKEMKHVMCISSRRVKLTGGEKKHQTSNVHYSELSTTINIKSKEAKRQGHEVTSYFVGDDEMTDDSNHIGSYTRIIGSDRHVCIHRYVLIRLAALEANVFVSID